MNKTDKEAKTVENDLSLNRKIDNNAIFPDMNKKKTGEIIEDLALSQRFNDDFRKIFGC
jgi:transcription termination factor Rho